MRYPSYPGMSDEDLIKYLDTWWKTASVKELVKRYKALQDELKEKTYPDQGGIDGPYEGC